MDGQENPFGFLESHLHLIQKNQVKGLTHQTSISEKKLKIKYPNGKFVQRLKDEETHFQRKNQKMEELKICQRKLKNQRLNTHYVCDESSLQGNNNNDSITCPVCSKLFHSKKALFGHMRCHPERQWRGIQPPPTPPPTLMMMMMMKKKNSSSSSTTFSSSVVTTMEDQIDSASTSGRRLGFDVLGSLSSWSVKAKRNRRMEAYSDGISDAIDGLLLLAHGNSLDFVSRNKKSIIERDRMWVDLFSKNDEFEEKEEVCAKTTKKRRTNEDESEDGYIDLPWKKVKIEFRNDDFRSGFVPKLMEMEPGEMGLIDYKEKPVLSNGGGFKCSTCNKSFPSHQALGGHKSSQRNCRSSFQSDYQCKDISNSNPNPNPNPNSNPNPNLIKVDDLKELNDNTRSKDVDYKHKCKVCGRTFPTGQALGGHQRCHWNGQVGTHISSEVAQPQPETPPSSSVASHEAATRKTTTENKYLDFDLNKLPMDVDEEFLSQLVPVFGITA